MKYIKVCLMLIAVALFSIGLCSTGYAFHSGGVAECEGCHTMHNSFAGATMTVNPLTTPGTTYAYLLKGSDQSSTCLNCHNTAANSMPSSYHISTDDGGAGVPPTQLTPGGDFGWLKKSYTWTPRTGTTETSPGERHGHNIVASDFGYVEESGNLTGKAPGGSYPVGSLSCISCHDPHGKYRRDLNGAIATSGKPIRNSGSYNTSADPDGSFSVGVYRLLGGNGYTPQSVGTNVFVNDPPAAVAPSGYNRTEAVTQTRVAYGKGMSEWCANCHTNMHNDNYPATLRHPSGNGAKLGAIAGNYNSYVKSGDLTGTSAASYTSLVPFEEGITDLSTTGGYAQLKGHALNAPSEELGGPDATTSNVACVSCHRAHASGWDSMTRFNLGYEFMVGLGTDSTGTPAPAYPGIDSTYVSAAAAQGRTVAETQRAYYDRPATKFAAYQRALCNKCHAKD